ncbi:MAG TPA: hypothetical protein VGL22_17215 [Terracidiphilus sp.]|jgi:hypothetical protein
MTAEVIVEVGADGGSLTLWGRKDQGESWEFWTRSDETAAFDLLDEEDRQGLGSAVQESNLVRSFSDGISLLDRYPWCDLTPLKIHPEFRESIVIEVRKRGTQRAIDRWARWLSTDDRNTADEGYVLTGGSDPEEYRPVELLDEEDLGPVVKERHIDFLLQEELQVSSKFLHNFVRAAAKSFVKVSGIGLASSPDFIQATLRPNSRIDSVRVKRSISDLNGESDLIVLYKLRGSADLIALLIEDKIHAPFQHLQAERYKERGVSGEKNEPKKWNNHWTCLVAPDFYIKRGHGFDSAVDLEQIKPWFGSTDPGRTEFKTRIIEMSIRKASITGVKVVDPINTAFYARYYEAFQQFFSGQLQTLSLRPPAPLDPGEQWFRVSSPLLGSGYITHRASRGIVDLTFPDTNAEQVKRDLSSVVEAGVTIEQTGKSTSLRCGVPAIKDMSQFSQHEAEVTAAFRTVQRLFEFYCRKQAQIHDAVTRASWRNSPS